MSDAADIEGFPDRITVEELLRLTGDRGAHPAERVRALNELGRRNATPASLLTETVVDPSEPPNLRQVAAAQLGDHVGAERQRALIAALDADEPGVLKSAAAALGRIGDEYALRVLEALDLPGDHPASAGAAFAKTLISYRLNLGSHLLEPPGANDLLPLDPSAYESMRCTDLPPDELRRAWPRIRREVPAVPLSRTAAQRIACSDDAYWLVFAQDAGELFSSGKDAGVVAVLLEESYCPGRCYLDEYLLVHPGQAGSLLVFGVLDDGVVVHFGTVRVNGNEAAFNLQAVNTLHSFPVAIAGAYSQTEKRLNFTQAMVGLDYAPSQVRPTVLRLEPSIGSSKRQQ